MLSSKNQAEGYRRHNKVPTFSLKKLSIGLVSLAIGGYIFVGNDTHALAEEVAEPATEVVEDQTPEAVAPSPEVSDAPEVVETPVAEENPVEELSDNQTVDTNQPSEIVTDVDEPVADTESVETDQEPQEDTQETSDDLQTVATDDTVLSDQNQAQEDEISLSEDTLYLTEEKEITFETSFEEDISEDKLAFTLGGRPLEEWQAFDFDKEAFEGDPWIRVENITVNGRQVSGSIVNDYPYGMNATDLRPFPRWNFEELMGTYELAIVNTASDERKSTLLKIDNYEGFHLYDELKPAIDNILVLAEEKTDRYFSYESLGKSYEGRDLHFVTVTKNKETLDRYLNETLKMAHEDPSALQYMIEQGELDDYQVPIFINNTHPDESPGVDAQIDMLYRLATLDDLTFTTKGVEKQVNVSELLDDFILFFSITMNPDGKYHNSRENSNKLDINRDNAYQTQIETQIMAETVAKYSPLAFLDFHGFVNPMLIEPTTPPHEPNFEYDLLMGDLRDPETGSIVNPNAPGAINHAIAMGEAADANTGIDGYQIPLLDWEDGWDDAGLGYTAVFTLLGGTLGHTIEIPQQNRESVLAAVYAMMGSMDYLSANKDALYLNQLEVFRRSIENEDNRAVDSWLVNSDLDIIGRDRGEYDNFFPDYYFIPVDASNQKNRLEAANMVNYFLRNGVKVFATSQAIHYQGVDYQAGTIVVPLAQVRRGLVNASLSTGMDESNWGGMYAELVLNFPAMRGFDTIAVRDLELQEDTLVPITENVSPISDINPIHSDKAILKATNNDALRLVNQLLGQGVKVSLIQEASSNAQPGDYLVATDDLDDYLLEYFVEYDGVDSKIVAKEIVQPKIFLAGPEDNYANLTTSTRFVLKQLGFSLVDDLDDANIIIDASGVLSAEDITGKAYIAIGSRALRSVIRNDLYDLDVRSERSTHEGLLHAIYNQDSVISGVYDPESIAYVASGSVLGEPTSETAHIFARVADRDDFYIEGWWPNHEEITAGGILGFTDVVDGQHMTFFATDVTNKAHTEYLYRLLANAIFNALNFDAEAFVYEADLDQPIDDGKVDDSVDQPSEDGQVGDKVETPSDDKDQAGPKDKDLIDIMVEDLMNQADKDSETTQVDPMATKPGEKAKGEVLPDTATATGLLGLLGLSSLIAGLGLKKKEDD